MQYKPPFSITDKALGLIQSIYRQLGYLAGAKIKQSPILLRKDNRIKTIHSSLAIEGNSLSIEQITSMLEGKRVLAPERDIIEVKNAISVYNDLKRFKPLSSRSLLTAHKIMMENLIYDNGKWREKGVGILKGTKVTHVAPQAKMVPTLINNLFEFVRKEKVISWIIKACVFHYELEFIHPFSDGNGRIGRLWQQLLLIKEDDIFEHISIETLIKNNQQKYYQVLATCDKAGHSTLFIEFMLELILSALEIYGNSAITQVKDPSERLNFALEHFKEKWFSRKEYILLHKDISSATASRDLKVGVSNGSLKTAGIKNQTIYKRQI